MPKIRPIQKSFSGGEISPRFKSRPDLDIYRKGVSFLHNFTTTPQGSVVKRKGSKFISEISDTLIYGRVFSFRISQFSVFQIVVTEDDITIHDRSGAVLVTTEMVNAGFDDGLTGWNVLTTKVIPSEQNSPNPKVIVINGICTVSSGSGAFVVIGGGVPKDPEDFEVFLNRATTRLSQQVSVTTGTNEHNLKIVIVPGSFDSTGILTDYISIGTTESASDISFTIDPMDSSNVIFTP